MPTISRSAVFASRVGLLAVVLCAAGVAAARFGWASPYLGFRIFAVGLLPGGLSALVLGAVGVVKTRASAGRRGRGSAVLGLLLGAALLVALILLVAPHRGAPAIHDVTTDPDDPPQFRELADVPDNRGRDLTYPHGGAGVAEAQRRAYPDLVPIRLALPPGEAFDAVLGAIESLGWTVVWTNRALGVVEAYDTSAIFRFVDDVAVRVRAAEGGSVVDVRSTSRVGVSDLGANAKRIRELTDRLGRIPARRSAMPSTIG